MYATSICSRLKKHIFNTTKTGKVHSVFKNACNLIVDEGDIFITLLSCNKTMSPMSMLLNTEESFDFRSLNLHWGTGFELSESEIVFYELGLHIYMTNAELWHAECEICGNDKGSSIDSQNMMAFEKRLLQLGRFSGMECLVLELAPSIPELKFITSYEVCFTQHKNYGSYNNFDFIKDRFMKFMQDYITVNKQQLKESLRTIIGFGIGLTPSVDDFINGMLLTNIYMVKVQKIPTDGLEAIHDMMLEGLIHKTTRVSYEMLKNGAMGLANEAVKNLMQQLIFGNPLTVGKAVEQVIDFGETSGTDTALGIYTGLKIWTNYGYRRLILNECMCGN